MSDQKKGKKRPKSYYIKCAAGGKKPRKTNVLSAGMKGFLVTCNKYERETVREMYNLLNEYADTIYGPELDNSAVKSADDSNSESEEEDMEKAMAKETSALKQASTSDRRFQNTSTKCNNVIFVQTTVEDPCRLAHAIFQDIYDKQVQKARYAIRMLPIEAICNPGNKEVEATLTSVLAPHFETDFGVGLKYTAACKIRNNNSVSKNMILTTLGKIIKEMNPLHQLCHDQPDLVIIAEVVQKSCCFSVVKDYFKFKKYNLHEIVRKPVDDTKEDTIEESIDVDKDDNVEDAETAELNENIEKTGENQEKNEENVVEKEVGQTTDTIGNNAVDSVEKEVSQTTDKIGNDAVDSVEKDISETNDKVDNDNAETVEKCKETNGDTDNCKKVETKEEDVQGKQESPKQEVNDETVI